MCDTGYSVKRLVEDMKELKAGGADDAAMAVAVPDLARRLLLMKHNWLRPHMSRPNTARPRQVRRSCCSLGMKAAQISEFWGNIMPSGITPTMTAGSPLMRVSLPITLLSPP